MVAFALPEGHWGRICPYPEQVAETRQTRPKNAHFSPSAATGTAQPRGEVSKPRSHLWESISMGENISSSFSSGSGWCQRRIWQKQLVYSEGKMLERELVALRSCLEETDLPVRNNPTNNDILMLNRAVLDEARTVTIPPITGELIEARWTLRVCPAQSVPPDPSHSLRSPCRAGQGIWCKVANEGPC